MQRKWLIAGIVGTLVIVALALIDDPAPSEKATSPGSAPPPAAASSPAAQTFQFTRSTFDDGWVSTVQPKWVEATKGGIKVLLHYQGDVQAANTDPDVLATAAWNLLVAPRYSNLRNYKTLGSVLNYERPYLAQGDLTDNASGQPRFVAIFNQGDSGWIEVVSPDQAAFTAAFGVDVERINGDRHGSAADALTALRRLAVYNKFAVAASDFAGKWSTNFSANTFYVNRYTGQSAGMSTYSSGQEYEFAGTRYKWSLATANSSGGRTGFASAKGRAPSACRTTGTCHFSDIEGKPRTYPAQFRAVEGGRILVIDGTAFVRAQ